MGKKKKAPPDPPSKAYLISFGDTMTALLAFFIVMNSLAQEQTGANLYSGTGSFVAALRSGGLPGDFRVKASENPFQKLEPGPLYIVSETEADPSVKSGTGPDEESNNLRIIERERDMLRRFFIELERLASISRLPSSAGRVMFDFFEPIEETSPLVSDNATDVFRQAMLRAGPRHQIEVVVWATTPGVSAWKRATREAQKVRSDLLDRLGVPKRFHPSVSATGKPWFFSDEKRPRFSFGVRKLAR